MIPQKIAPCLFGFYQKYTTQQLNTTKYDPMETVSCLQEKLANISKSFLQIKASGSYSCSTTFTTSSRYTTFIFILPKDDPTISIPSHSQNRGPYGEISTTIHRYRTHLQNRGPYGEISTSIMGTSVVFLMIMPKHVFH